MTGKIEISVSDITGLERDCIVNAANSSLQMGGGVCGAIFRAAGARELQQACNAMGGCPTGSAVLTPGFRLKAKYIAHAVGPIWRGGEQGEPQMLYSCYQSALTAARKMAPQTPPPISRAELAAFTMQSVCETVISDTKISIFPVIRGYSLLNRASILALPVQNSKGQKVWLYTKTQ